MTQLLVGRLVDRVSLPSRLRRPLARCSRSVSAGRAAAGVPLLVGLVAAMAAHLRAGGRQRRHDRALRAAGLQAKAFGLRYFLGFTTSGLAVLLIGALHAGGGFPLVLAAAAAFRGAGLLSAVAFAAVTQRTLAVAAPAE